MKYSDRAAAPPRTLTDAEVRRVLAITGRDRAGFRDHVIISLAATCGLREGEILALDVGDVANRLADGRARRIIQLRAYKGRKQGAKPDARQRAHVPEATWAKLAKFVQGRRREGAELGDPLFVSRFRSRLSSRQVRTMFRRWQERAKFDVVYNFHALRHTAITAVRRQTGDIRVAQLFARHASAESTARYDHPSDEELSTAVRRLKW